MTIQSIGLMAVVDLALALASSNVLADGDEVKFNLSTSVDYTSGDYGGTDDIEDLYISVTGTARYGRFGYELTVPYLSVRAPSGTIITDAGGQSVPGSGARTIENGLGAIVGSVTLYDVINYRDFGIAMDITAEIKFATADEDKGLGTGEHDYSVQADFYKFFDQLTILGSAGYKLRGDPSGIDLENALLASVGGFYKFTPQTRAGLIYDYQESAFTDGESLRELTGFVSQRISDVWWLQVDARKGFSDSSPDWGGGVTLTRAFD